MKNTNKKKRPDMLAPFTGGIIFLAICVLLFLQPQKAFALIPSYKPQDSCGLININFASTGPSCPVFSTYNGSCQNPSGNPTSSGINSQTLTVTLSSNDGRAHQVSYSTANNFCTNGYLSTSGAYCNCVDNALYDNQIVTVPVGHSVPIQVTRSPTIGSNCGSYQLDFTVDAVDGNTNCNSGNGSSDVGGSLTCETGITCSGPPPPPPPPPDCTTTPINCSPCAAPADTCSNGNGTQTCTLSQPQTCSAVTIQRACTLNNCNAGKICSNQACIVPTYTISGNIFNDLNKNGKIDGGENNYAGTPSVSATRGNVTVNANGSYTISNITAGTVTVRYTSLPATYYMTSPLNGPPPSFSVTVGTAGCTVNGAPGATCNAGNITNLNFGISNLYPWIQSTCGDIRNDNGITNLEPAGQLAGNTSASCTNPGILFTGDTTANFGQGQASSSKQTVGGFAYPEVFPTSSTLDTAYPSLLTKAQAAGITPTNLASVCNLTNCTLPANLPHGIYLANGDVNLNAHTFNPNANYVILINGNLTIRGTVSVPTNATALLSTTKNITIDATVGTPPNNTNTSLDGWYIAGQNFIVNSVGNCNDLRLNIGGTVVVNAMGSGGTFQNNRDLCGNDANNPTVSFVQRLDMILNAPQFLRQQQTISQELAP